MKKVEVIELDFEIDKLTNSIENAQTGEVFDTDIAIMNNTNSGQIKKAEWQFDWHKEIKKADRNVYKLITLRNPGIIHGLISITDNEDHMLMHLIESAVFNKGKNKIYNGIPGNLVAYACKTSFEKGYDGIVAFIAKTQLIDHYKISLGAKILTGNKMYIDTKEALKIVKQYFQKIE